ncbi:MAG: CoA pyrophosphatase [Marinicaulis sp.]|nr:CoA pyrophosphatase [Marinicaulis sp.]NNL88556.1 CoA pyrophosphatase [Marinicaulis sp.]
MTSWRHRITDNLQRYSAQRVRALFNEINPHLVGDKLFESRWSDIRRDAAVLVPVVDRGDDAGVILTVRSSEMPSHAGQISFPGGKVEKNDENRVATALREANEEIALDPNEVEIAGALGVHQGGLGFSVTPIVGFVHSNAKLSPCPREVDEIFEVPLSHVANLDNHVTEERIHEGIHYNMFAIPYGRFHIWGLTAGILRTFAETLQGDEDR